MTMIRGARIVSLAAVVALCPLAVMAQRAEPPFRPYIVETDDLAVRESVPVRHIFRGKFTADLNVGQVRALRQQGLKVNPVQLFEPTKPPGKCDPWPECKNGDGGGTGDGGTDATRTVFPDDQTPWGIEVVYNDPVVLATSGGALVWVAVLDTGVHKEHLDLKNRVEQCVDFTGGGPPGVVRIKEGSCQDKFGHGTHVAGTILADGGSDGLGIYVLAPEARLLAYKVCGDAGCWGDDIAAAIDYAGDRRRGDADIVSMSLGGDSQSSLIRDAIGRNPHLLVVAAAGNDGPAEGTIDYPGANAAVVAVGAIDAIILVPSFSSRGINDGDYIVEAREVEFGAPGVAVESTWTDGGYRYLSGTSMATPHVSGLAAKLWQGDAAKTRATLQSLAEDIWDIGDDSATGFGLSRLPALTQ